MSISVRQLAARVEPGRVGRQQGPTPRPTAAPPATPFADQLAQAQGPDFKLSAHAQQRVEQRGITMGPAEQASIEEAFRLLGDRGAQDALLLRNDAAFVVNVPNKTVVTAMNQHELKQRVFTNIDSAFLL